MRKRITTLIAAVLLATVHGAAAQDPPTKPVPPPEVPAVGLFDIGFRGTSVDGDEARHERYRDLRSGASTFFEMQKNTEQLPFRGVVHQCRLSRSALLRRSITTRK